METFGLTRTRFGYLDRTPSSNVAFYEVDLVTGSVTEISNESSNYYGRFIVTNGTPTAANRLAHIHQKTKSLSQGCWCARDRS